MFVFRTLKIFLSNFLCPYWKEFPQKIASLNLFLYFSITKNTSMNSITVEIKIQASISHVWEYWTLPEHITKWNFASWDWHCPEATINLTEGGEFHFTMAAKDSSASFDFWGTYVNIEKEKHLEILLGDGRKMSAFFESTENGTNVREVFEAEKENSLELQKTGWQMILENFKKYAETQAV